MKRLSLVVALCAMTTLVLGTSENASAVSKDTSKNKRSAKVITVKAGDTLSSIAKTHKTTYARLFNANKQIANPDMIDVGDKIRVPGKKEKLKDRFSHYQSQVSAAAAPAATTYTTREYSAQPLNSSSYYVGNGMWCTDYVHSKRSDIPVYGNAGYGWLSAARADGKSTGSTPRAGAVAVMNGHVAYVEKVNKDGSYVVSEMGWNYQAGNYNKRTVRPGTFGGFIY